MKKNKLLLITHLVIAGFALLMLFILPSITIHIYDVYIYNLSRTEISKISLNFFEISFHNNYLNSAFVFVLTPLLLFAAMAFDIFFYKQKKKWMFFVAFGLSVFLLFFLSFTNTIFAKTNKIEAYCFIRTFSNRFPNFPILFPQTHLNQESIWIDLGLGTLLAIVFIGLKIAIYFLVLFLDKKFLNCTKYFGSSSKTIIK